MRFSAVAFVGLATAVSAHFHLEYPPPRGPFEMQDELSFCDDYANAVDNRTAFPLSGGIYSLTSEHPAWILGVLISTVQNPNNFANFTTSSGQEQLAVPFFQADGEGAFCFPIDISTANIPGVQNGANVTLQFVFDGGDGELYQCADLTLRNDAIIPGNVSCTNASSPDASFYSSGVIPSFTSSSTAPASTSTGAAAKNVAGATGLLGVVGVILSLL